jgi:glycosyltransferase involved in cell wall biosynthesis
MRIALCSSFVPFVNGGYRNIIEWLEVKLLEAGHQVERVYLPEHDDKDLLFRQMAAFRFVDLSAADRLICFRPQSHLVPHPNKVVWFIHHLRPFYDLWDNATYRGFPDDPKHQGLRDALHAVDSAALREARRVFSNSKIVGDRLARFNDIDSEVLYPPILHPERFVFRGMNDEIVCVCRIEHHKRQHLLVEALQHCRSNVRLRLCGASFDAGYVTALGHMATDQGVADRLTIDSRWITEDEKADLLADCLATAYLPLDEDSYGYPTLEAAHASKPTLTAEDSGGVLEFVVQGINGSVASPDPRSIALEMDRLFDDRNRARQLGQAANARIADLNIDWPHVIERLLA